MSLSAPPVEDLFSDTVNSAERAERFEAYKAALNKSAERTHRGEFVFRPGEDAGTYVESPASALERVTADLGKTLTADQLASLATSVEAAKAATADLGKDITLTSPLSTGLVPYDLEAPAKMLVPRATPLRNRIPRKKGQGTAKRFKRITGYSNSGAGGVAALRPGITDASTESFGSLTLRRGPKISYASDEKAVLYKQFGLSDMVTWSAEFSGQGFQDIRQLSQTALLWASMIADEKMILGGRGTDTGYVGALAAPAAATVTARNAGTGETGNSANIANLFIYITAVGLWGESAPSTVLNSTALAAATGKVLDVAITPVTGALGYKIYAGLTTGIANAFLYGSTAISGTGTGLGTAPFSIQFTGGGTGGALAAGTQTTASDTSATANEFDGFLTVLADPTQSGYVGRVNGLLSTTNPGIEYQNAFADLYDPLLADPDEVLMNGYDRKQLSEAIKGGSTTPGYRLQINQDEASGVVLGSMVTAMVNEVTGKMVDVAVHPYMPQGNSLVLSHSLPISDSEVADPTFYALVQDYMAINWPVIQHTYDTSSYWYGALVHQAPAFSGFVGGIKAA